MFLHTWSLSLEEQFYIVYPILAVFILKKYKAYFRYVCILLCTVGFLFFAYFAEGKPQASFYLLPFRFWELLVGCSVASFQTSHSKSNPVINRYHSVIAWIGLFLILLSFFLIDSNNGIGVSLIIPTLGTAIVLFIKNDSCHYIKLFLCNFIITFIGRISYSLYLWHWPLLYYLKHFEINSFLLYPFILFLISSISYFLIEKPARINSKSLPIILSFFISCIIFSIFIIKSEGIYDTSSFNKTVWSGFLYDSIPPQEKVDYGKEFRKRMNGIYLTKKLHETSNVSRPLNNHTLDQGYDILVIGDSHSLMWSPIIDEIALENNLTTSFKGSDGRFQFLENFSMKSSNTDNDFSYENIKKAFIHNKCLVFIITRWDNYPDGNLDIEDLVEYIHKRGSKSILVEQPPVLYFGDKNAPQYLSFLGHHPPDKNKVFIKHNANEYWADGNNFAERLSKTYSSCNFFRTSSTLLKNNKALVILNNDVLYIDDDHLSLSGANLFKERLKEVILENISILQGSAE